MSEIMTIKELAGYIKMNARTVYKLVNNAEIPAVKLSNQWRFKKETIDEWLEAQMYKNVRR
ncbi:helix-turn-helix domain-containing protein [bacterium]|nr:helix-turn-helix domain-containing protein [bacterium]